MIKTTNVKIGIVGAILLYLLIKGTIESSHSACKVLDLFRNYKFNGIIINKYIDKEDHATKKVIIKNFDAAVPDTLTLLDWDKTGLYNKINKNDTIIKELGSNSVYLKNNASEFNYVLD